MVDLRYLFILSVFMQPSFQSLILYLYRCSEDNCDMTFKSKETLKKHVDNIHLRKKPKKYKV